MKKEGILFILIQIDEAHSSAWPVGLIDQPEPQKNIQERIERANIFVQTESVPFPVYVDTWQNDFAETYHAWPDKYYCFDSDFNVLVKSEYGSEGEMDAKIKLDCVTLINNLLSC